MNNIWLILDTYKKVSCGGNEIPYIVAQITSITILVLEILIPIIIIVFGMIDLVKSITTQKEDEIKKGWQIFIKRLIIGLLVFLVVVGIKFIIGIIPNNGVVDCIDCFVNNNQCNVK